MPNFVNTHAEFVMCLEEHTLVAVDFTASWCGPCKHIGPVFAKLANEFPQIHFVKVDVDENAETAAHHNVQAMPTFAFFHRGQRVADVVGASSERLKAALVKLSALAAVEPEPEEVSGTASPSAPNAVLRPPVLE